MLDLDTLLALEETSFAGDRIARRGWRRLIRSPSALILIAERGDRMAGALVLLFRQNSRVARIYSIAVATPYRGAGIGQMLIENAVLAAAGRGCTQIRLETRLDNTSAQTLFARSGFTVTGRTPAYYHDGQSALRLARPTLIAA